MKRPRQALTSAATSGVAMTGGILLIGLSGFVFLTVIGHHRYTETDWAALSLVYVLTNLLGPGLFSAVEQEISRRTAAAVAGSDAAPPLRRLIVIASALAALTAVALLAAAPLIVPHLLADRWGLFVAALISLAGSAAVYLVRGYCSGTKRFVRYGETLLVDGTARILLPSLAVAGGVDTPETMAVLFCLAPALGALAGLSGLRSKHNQHRIPGRRTPWRELIASTASLVGSVGLALAMTNLGAVVVGFLLTDDLAITAFVSAVALTRLPMLALGPIQATLIPRFVDAVTGHGSFGRQVRLVGVVLIGVIAVSTPVFALAGGWVLRLLFGVQVPPSIAVFAGLALGAGVLLSAQVLQPALLALGLHHKVLICWVVGFVVYAVCFLIPIDAVARATLAQFAGPAVVLGAFAAMLRQRRTSAAVSAPSAT